MRCADLRPHFAAGHFMFDFCITGCFVAAW